MQEGTRLGPITLYGAPSDTHGLGNLILGEATEESVLDHAGQSRIECGEPLERLVELQQRVGLIVSSNVCLVESEMVLPTAPFPPHPCFGAIDQHMSHREGCDGEEVCTIAPLRPR